MGSWSATGTPIAASDATTSAIAEAKVALTNAVTAERAYVMAYRVSVAQQLAAKSNAVAAALACDEDAPPSQLLGEFVSNSRKRRRAWQARFDQRCALAERYLSLLEQ